MRFELADIKANSKASISTAARERGRIKMGCQGSAGDNKERKRSAGEIMARN